MKKFNKRHPDDVTILLAVFRVDAKNTDIVLTCNVPVETTIGTGVGLDALSGELEVFKKAVEEFKIVDFGLFA